MEEILQKLKGITCILSVLSYQAETTQFKYQTEAMDFLSDTMYDCIDELEKLKTEYVWWIKKLHLSGCGFFIPETRSGSGIENWELLILKNQFWINSGFVGELVLFLKSGGQ